MGREPACGSGSGIVGPSCTGSESSDWPNCSPRGSSREWMPDNRRPIMTTFTHADLLALARGQVLPPDVFEALVADPAAIEQLNGLLRLRCLFDAEDDTFERPTTDVTL